MFYTLEVALLMQHLGWEKAHIVGMSMVGVWGSDAPHWQDQYNLYSVTQGGPIACAFAVNFPKLVDGKVALLAPAGLMQDIHISAVPKFVSSRIGLYVATSSVFKSILGRLYTQHGDGAVGEELIKLQQLVLPHHIAAVASSIRDGPLRELDYAFAKLGKSDTKVLVVWGTADTVVPYSLATQVLTHIPRAKLVTVAGAGHDLLITHAEEVGAALVDFLR
ncbi:hypothetical protein FRC01_000130 [Tulasnella sp. 417]|nr:hypothetical protein FRC01_000130 [Tulasnella sp. 417]